MRATDMVEDEDEDEEGEPISDVIQRRYDAATTPKAKLAVMEEYFGDSAKKMLNVMEGAYVGSVIDLSQTGGRDPRDD